MQPAGRKWMIYGAYGYTGRLIAEEACRRGMRPVLAGRSAGRLLELSARLGCEHRSFELDEPGPVNRAVADCDLVLHCAGPFSATARPMMQACVETSTHYLDISGEIDVFEYGHSIDEPARRAGIVLCSGVGFDVIPTDCMAAALQARMPDADHLALGFDTDLHVSPGTAKTSFEGLARGGRVRRDGRIVSVPLAWRTRRVDFGRGEKLAVTIPWGDVSTAWYTTNIPNIETYIAASPKLVKRLTRANALRPLLRFGPIQRYARKRIASTVAGPDAAQRAAAKTWLWGETRNPSGNIRSARLVTANGYDVTVHGSLAIVDHLLRKGATPGATTPSRLVGSDFICGLPGSSAFQFH